MEEEKLQPKGVSDEEKKWKKEQHTLSDGCTGITTSSHTLTVSWLHPNTRSTDEASCERNRWDIIVCVCVCVIACAHKSGG